MNWGLQMKSFEQLVKEYYEPSPKKDVGSLVIEMVEQAISEEEASTPEEPSEFQKALDIVEKEGYHYDTPRRNAIRIRAINRLDVMDKMTKMLEPMGYVHHYDGSTLGRLQRIDRRHGSVYIYFKPPFGSRAADLGALEEENFVRMARKLAGKLIRARSAGSSHGSDLTLEGPKGTLTIEVKTGISADFGQFSLRYNIGKEKWEPSTTSKFLQNSDIFMPLFSGYIDEYVQSNYTMKMPLDDRFQVRNLMSKDRSEVVGKVVTSIRQTPTTGEFKRQLENKWYGGKNDKMIEFPFEMIAKYYSDKGDRFIQLGNKGLYALNRQDAEEFGIPLFQEVDVKSKIRLRLKPQSGANSRTAFNVAIKINAGKLKKSPLNLRNEEDMMKVLTKIM